MTGEIGVVVHGRPPDGIIRLKIIGKGYEGRLRPLLEDWITRAEARCSSNALLFVIYVIFYKGGYIPYSRCLAMFWI